MSSYHGKRKRLHRKGHPTYRLCRYADDLVLMVMGTRDQAKALLEQLSGRVQALGLKLKAEKTALTHIDEGFVFLGQKIIGRTKHGKHLVYTFATNEALASIKRKVKALTGRSTTNLALSELIAALNPAHRGWVNYYRHAAANRTFSHPDHYVWWRVERWLRNKHPQMNWKQINRRYLNDDHTYQNGGITLYKPAARALRATGTGEREPRPRGRRRPNDPPASTTREPPGTTAARTNPTGARMKQIPPATQTEPDAATSRKSDSPGDGEETTDRKTGTGASPPTQRLRAERRVAASAAERPRTSTSRTDVRGYGPGQN